VQSNHQEPEKNIYIQILSKWLPSEKHRENDIQRTKRASPKEKTVRWNHSYLQLLATRFIEANMHTSAIPCPIS